MMNHPLVFVSYAKEDKDRAKELYCHSKKIGLNPWLDEEDILPGEVWVDEIRKTICSSDFFVICLSKASVNKRGFIQKEIGIALDVLDEIPEGKIYLIPVRLEECDVPKRLSSYQWVDLFEPDGLGFHKLLKSLTLGSKQSYQLSDEIPEWIYDSVIKQEVILAIPRVRAVKLEDIARSTQFNSGDVIDAIDELRAEQYIDMFRHTKWHREYILSEKGASLKKKLVKRGFSI